MILCPMSVLFMEGHHTLIEDSIGQLDSPLVASGFFLIVNRGKDEHRGL